MQFSKTSVAFFAALLVLSACNKVEFQKTSAGVPYKVFGSDKGDSIKVGNFVKFEVIQKVKDSVLFSSYKNHQAQFFPIQTIAGPVKYNDIQGNLMEIFMKAHKGDSIYITQSADSLLNENPEIAAQAPFKKGDEIITTVKIIEVYPTRADAQNAMMKDRTANAEVMDKEALDNFKADTSLQRQMAVDDKIIADYLQQNNIQAQKTSWGVYVQVLDPGQGPKPKPGQYALVQYRGTTLKGTEFDAGTFPLQIGTGSAIKGFEEGVKQLAAGGKARIFIPSLLAYGERGSAPKIGPNEILIFDIELKSISDTDPQQPTATPQGQPQ